jgi:DNA repair photolyase
MKEIAAVAEFGAGLSIPTLDEKAWRATEPHTPHPKARLEAVAELTRAGIRTGILIAPLMPGINDSPEQVEPILEMAAEAGAAYVTAIPLHLRRETKDVFLDWMREQRPDLLGRYERLYGNRAYLRQDEQERLRALVKGDDRRPWERMRGRRAPPSTAPAAPRPPAEQQRLF